MTTGTEGNDNLTNDPSAEPETVNSVGGDDYIRLEAPTRSEANGGAHVHVDGGAGYDTLFWQEQVVYGSSVAGEIGYRQFRDYISSTLR
jgi:hypothetical protein